MSGNSPQQDALIEVNRQSAARLGQAYNIAVPSLQTEYGALNAALAQGGEPDYLKKAYEEVRGGEREGLALGGIAPLKASLAKAKGSGEVGAGITPQMLGGSMASALYGSRAQEAMGSIEQMNKLYGASLGQAQQTGSGALAATGNQLANISGMRNYNSTYAGILGALNLGGSIYGGYQNATRQYPSPIPYDPSPGLTSGYGG